MFGSGLVGNIARAGIGGYNLFNKDGIQKTAKYINNGQYGKAAVSGARDLLNAGMAYGGYKGLRKSLNIYKQGLSNKFSKVLSKNLNKHNIPYYSQFNPQEAKERMASDIKRGYQNFKDWMTNPYYLESTLNNIKEAKQMGLNYTPTYDKPQYKALLNDGIKINFLKQMQGNGSTSMFGAVSGQPTPVNLNLGSRESFLIL